MQEDVSDIVTASRAMPVEMVDETGADKGLMQLLGLEFDVAVVVIVSGESQILGTAN